MEKLPNLELEQPAPPSLLRPRKLEDGMGLSLSGGGYRAMLFHLGAFYRLNEVGLLSQVSRIASVSGGSLAAAALALGWDSLKFSMNGIASNLTEVVAAPLLRLADSNIDIKAIALGMVPGVSASGVAAYMYNRILCDGKTLQDLPKFPRFVFVATSLQTGSIWRFSKDYAADYQVGQWISPDLALSTVLAASAGFPPYLSPCKVRIPEGKIQTTEGATHNRAPFNRTLLLTDGGVYDNLGLEPVWKRYKTLLVSDGGALTGYQGRPRGNWLQQSIRVNSIAMQQVIYLRKRFLRDVDSYKERDVLLWSISEPLAGTSPLLPLLSEQQLAVAANVPTRLKRLDAELKKLIVRSGYVHCERAIASSKLIKKSVPSELPV